MTMKRLLYIAFFSGLLLSVSTSCNDLFKEVPYDKLSENAIWGDQLLLDEYVLPWYRNMDNGFSTYVTTIMKGIGREYEPWYADQMTVSRLRRHTPQQPAGVDDSRTHQMEHLLHTDTFDQRFTPKRRPDTRRCA